MNKRSYLARINPYFGLAILVPSKLLRKQGIRFARGGPPKSVSLDSRSRKYRNPAGGRRRRPCAFIWTQWRLLRRFSTALTFSSSLRITSSRISSVASRCGEPRLPRLSGIFVRAAKPGTVAGTGCISARAPPGEIGRCAPLVVCGLVVGRWAFRVSVNRRHSIWTTRVVHERRGYLEDHEALGGRARGW